MSETIKNAIEFTNSRALTLSRLKQISPYYPEYFKSFENNQLLLSTLIRKQKDGIWHTVHLVKEFILEPVELEKAYDIFNSTAYSIINLHIITDRDKIDQLQISEEERLKKLNLIF
ncbi:MAG TPA: hypothetical protein VEA37_02860 [Flavobacterium sp.]|nr:hypothetical protein [Flavobacterium sp.]